MKITMRYGVAIMRPQNYIVNRAAFITTLIKDFEKPYLEFLAHQLDAVIGKNEALTGAPCYYLGDTVYARGLIVAKVGKYKLGNCAVLDPSLYALHDDWRSHYTSHNETWARFTQALRVILMKADTWQELRDMLPNRVLTPYLEAWGFKGLTRTRPDLQTCALQQSNNGWDPDLIQQYTAISETVDLYVGYRLL